MNLLPITQKELLQQGMRRRFLANLSVFTALAFLIGLVMLLPTYFLTAGYIASIRSESLSVATGNEDAKREILKLPNEIESKLKFFQTNTDNGRAVSLLEKVVEVLPEKTTLKSINFEKDQSYKGKKGVSMVLSGTAANREALVSFSNNLKALNIFYAVDIPVSSLTKDKDLPFTINLFVVVNTS